MLLKFFEQLASFLAIVHISAFRRDDGLWNEIWPAIHQSLSDNNLHIKTSSFGWWKHVFDRLSKHCEQSINDDEEQKQDLMFDLYGTRNRRFLQRICHADLRTVLGQANALRNQETGHGGAEDRSRSEEQERELMELVSVVRGVFGRAWTQYELIRPGKSEYRNGEHTYDIERIMGRHSNPFESSQRVSVNPLESGVLHLFDQDGQTGLMLEQMIKVIPSPQHQQTACYTYNRIQGNELKFVSYHLGTEPDHVDEFPLAKALVDELS